MGRRVFRDSSTHESYLYEFSASREFVIYMSRCHEVVILTETVVETGRQVRVVIVTAV